MATARPTDGLVEARPLVTSGRAADRGATDRLPDAYVESIVDAPHEAFVLDDDGRIRFRDAIVLGRLARSSKLLKSEVSARKPMSCAGPLEVVLIPCQREQIA